MGESQNPECWNRVSIRKSRVIGIQRANHRRGGEKEEKSLKQGSVIILEIQPAQISTYMKHPQQEAMAAVGRIQVGLR